MARDKVKYIGVDVGDIKPFPFSSIPSGWLECNGASLSKAAYPELFAVLGVTFGGTTTNFNLPNYTGKFLRGFGGASSAIGVTQAESVKQHSHSSGTITASKSSDGAHGHDWYAQDDADVWYVQNRVATGTGAYAAYSNTTAFPTTSALAGGYTLSGESIRNGVASTHTHTNTMSGSSAVDSSNTETRPINTAVRYCIKY